MKKEQRNERGAQSAPGAGQCRIKWDLFPVEEYDTGPFIAAPWFPSEGYFLWILYHQALAGRKYLSCDTFQCFEDLFLPTTQDMYTYKMKL